MKFCRHVNILVTIIFRWGLIGWVTETLENIEQNETDKAEVETEIQGRILNETENGMKKRDREKEKRNSVFSGFISRALQTISDKQTSCSPLCN